MAIILILTEIFKSHDKEQVSGKCAKVHGDVGRGSRPGYSDDYVMNRPSGISWFRPQFILPYRVQDFELQVHVVNSSLTINKIIERQQPN